MKKSLKIIIIAIVVIAFTLSFTTPIFGGGQGKAGMPEEKATGGVGYIAFGLQRYAEFNAFELLSTSSVDWNLDGNWVLDLNSTNWPSGNPYRHDMVISGGTASGGWPTGGSYINSWNATVSLIGNQITIVAVYLLGSGVFPYTFTAIGTIAPDGTMTSGTWTDSLKDIGDWSSTLGAATQIVTGYDGKGMFHYSDVNGDWYYADVKYVNVDGTDAYFAGLVTSASQASWVGNWVSVAVHDGGEPAYLVDAVWGTFTDENTAKLNVANKTRPDGEFLITSGNLQVHTYN
jgi:hypothetical protein